MTNFPFLLTYTFLPKVEKLLQNHFSSASNPSAPKSNQSSITKAKEPSAAKSNQSSITKTKETTVKASVLNDKVDIIDQGIPIEWISVQKFNQRVCDCPYVEVTSTTPNIEAVFKTIEALSSKSFGLSTNMTIDVKDALYISFSGELEAFNPRQKEIYDTMKQVTGGDTNANAKQLEQREHFTLHINSQLKVIFSEGNDIVCYHKGKDSATPCKKPKHGTSSSKAFLTPLQKSLATFSDLVEDCKYFYTSDENSEIQYEVWTTADEREARTCCWIQLIDIRENGENETYVVADTYTCADE